VARHVRPLTSSFTIQSIDKIFGVQLSSN